ncbi:MAG: DNA ligase [Candidatus Anoxychlamydiales bacterium]|nr:DNA ligase [Candidatus Anoxychlamydiales bacterium]
MKEIKDQKEYINLVDELIEHDEHYYVKNKPLISDYEYDRLLNSIQSWEKKHPDFILDSSPSLRISEALTKGFLHKEHIEPMLSLANTYSIDEITDFINRVYKLLNKKDIKFTSELKLDGTAISIRYDKGKLTQAVTRGNGKIGDDVTNNIKTIKSIPLTLKGKNIPDLLEVRGEVFMNIKTFKELNKKREEEGKDVFANPRNAAAGSLKLLDPKEVSRRRLNIILYGIANAHNYVNFQYEVHKFLQNLNLPTSNENHYKLCKSADEIVSFANRIEKERKKLFFEIDGIVIKVDDLSTYKKLGFTGKFPRYAAAYKFKPDQAITTIEDIIIQIGRTGILTPVAVLKPTFLAGSTISRATLHNQDEIDKKDIRIGDIVIIEKGGDVIPKVVNVDFSKRKKNIKKFKIPNKCPICKSEAKRFDDEVAIRCISPTCAGKTLRRFQFFASKQALDIEHLGSKVMQMLYEKGFVKRLSDIYTLDEGKLSQLEGFKDKSIKNLLESIEKSKKCTLSQFIMGLGIKYIGSETADLLANYAKNIDKLKKLTKEELLSIEGIGEKASDAIIEFFIDKKNIEEIDLLIKHGLNPNVTKQEINQTFLNKIFVLTGSLEAFTRDGAKKMIKERGGKVTSSVSKNTDFVLAGDEPGSKYDKAKKLSIKIISEKEFKSML